MSLIRKFTQRIQKRYPRIGSEPVISYNRTTTTLAIPEIIYTIKDLKKVSNFSFNPSLAMKQQPKSNFNHLENRNSGFSHICNKDEHDFSKIDTNKFSVLFFLSSMLWNLKSMRKIGLLTMFPRLKA